MKTSTYDPCLLISDKKEIFGLVGMQTDNTLILGNKNFILLENDEIINANLIAKPIQTLSSENPLVFNGCILTFDEKDKSIKLLQKDQGKRNELIDDKLLTYKQDYVKQRARGAYIASICQPEASFSLSVAAQNQNPTRSDIEALNKCLKWQKDNLDRGIRFIPLNLRSAKLYAFVDGSFANNKDYTSQIGFIIILANEQTGENEFTLSGNIIHWSSVKCKRVTRSVLASELYAMVHGIDIAIAISSTLRLITNQLGIEDIPTVICTDSFSLYECMVKLGTTKEKRLMIEIMAIRQSYERRELSEIRWINGNDNPADTMTKSSPTKALEQILNSNTLRVRVEGWVQRLDISMESSTTNKND